MKKSILTVASVALVALAATKSFGQSQVAFSNSHTGSPVIYGNGANSGSAVFGSAGTYEFGLYMGAFGSTDISQMQLVDTVLSINTSSGAASFAGFINGSTINSPGNTANTIDFAAGTEYAFLVAAWQVSDGASYSAAVTTADQNGFLGVSALGFITPSSSPSPAAQIFGSGSGQIGGFSILQPVPEPTTLALGGLGAAALLLFRRRK